MPCIYPVHTLPSVIHFDQSVTEAPPVVTPMLLVTHQFEEGRLKVTQHQQPNARLARPGRPPHAMDILVTVCWCAHLHSHRFERSYMALLSENTCTTESISVSTDTGSEALTMSSSTGVYKHDV